MRRGRFQTRKLHRRSRRSNPPAFLPPLLGASLGGALGYYYATKQAPATALAPTLASQVGIVTTELASLLSPLSAYSSGTYSSAMYMPPSGTVGAWFRVAYWSSVGSRIALSRGVSWVATALSLRYQALRAFSIAMGLAGLSATEYLTGSVGQLLSTALAAANPFASVTPVDSSEPGAVAAVFLSGVEPLRSAQIPQVADLLERLAATPPRPETSLSARINLPDFAPAWLKQWVGTATTVTWVSAGAAAGGLGGFLAVKGTRGLLRARRRNPAERISGSIPAWIPLLIGTGLIIFPEPATTAIGSLIVLGTLGLEAGKRL